jgi:hypothetical protein
MIKIIILIAAYAIAATATAQTPSPQNSVLNAAGGRYVFGQISELRRDQYLLDTLTGRLWLQICAVPRKDDPNQCAVSALQPIAFSDSKGNVVGFTPTPSSK